MSAQGKHTPGSWEYVPSTGHHCGVMENNQHCYSFYEKPEPLSRVVAYGTLLFALFVVMCAAVGFHSILEWVLS